MREITPSNIIVLIDLDRQNSKTDRALDLALIKTLNIIKEKLNARPSVLWSGRGYHVIQPINSNGVILENVDKFLDTPDISLHFLRFAESYLSAKKSDLQHNTTVSFNNCMLRIPGSFNSKNGRMVEVIRKWDHVRPEINPMLFNFRLYMSNQKYLYILNSKKRQKEIMYVNDLNTTEIAWIEKLLKTPLADHRKYCIWRILTPYLVNKRKLSYQESFKIIQDWLQQCNSLRKLGFNLEYRVNDSIERAYVGYMPIARDTLRDENPELYHLLNG